MKVGIYLLFVLSVFFQPGMAIGETQSCYTSVDREDWESARVHCEAAALEGDNRSQFEVASLLYWGRGYQQSDANDREAIRWAMMAAEDEYFPAVAFIGQMYQQGVGVPRDLSVAASWFEKGDAISHWLLGQMYQKQDELDDLKLAVFWLERAATAGHLNAQVDLSYLYYNLVQFSHLPEFDSGRAGASELIADLENRYRILGDAAVKASSGAEMATGPALPRIQAVLGLAYSKGLGVTIDYEKAYGFLRFAANNNDVWGQWGLGQLYENGYFVEKNEVEARQLFQLAAEDHSDARESLALMQFYGRGGAQDLHTARINFQRGNESGRTFFYLSLIFRNPTYFDYDVRRAIDYLQQACDSSNYAPYEQACDEIQNIRTFPYVACDLNVRCNDKQEVMDSMAVAYHTMAEIPSTAIRAAFQQQCAQSFATVQDLNPMISINAGMLSGLIEACNLGLRELEKSQ